MSCPPPLVHSSRPHTQQPLLHRCPQEARTCIRPALQTQVEARGHAGPCAPAGTCHPVSRGLSRLQKHAVTSPPRPGHDLGGLLARRHTSSTSPFWARKYRVNLLDIHTTASTPIPTVFLFCSCLVPRTQLPPWSLLTSSSARGLLIPETSRYPAVPPLRTPSPDTALMSAMFSILNLING